MNLEHVVRALDEQNKVASQMLEIMKLQEERNVRSEERQVQAHAIVVECGQLAIEREKRMAIIDAENAERMKQFKDQIQIEFPAAAKKETN
jgi:hypothetical protein